MVIEPGAASPRPFQVKPSQSSLGDDLADRAATALEEAREMPAGNERTEAMHKATVLRNAADVQQLLGSKRSAPAA